MVFLQVTYFTVPIFFPLDSSSIVTKGKPFGLYIGARPLIIFELHLNLFGSKVELIILNPG